MPDTPAMAYFPLTTDQDPIGVLEFRTAQTLTQEQVRLVCSILRVYRNFQGLLDYSERDTLTGLLNRKTFDESFMRVGAALPPTAGAAVGDARRHAPRGSAWLGVIDTDHFKRVNDGHGHLIGDEVLLLLWRLMRTSFRCHDHLHRFGGEEFVVLLRCNQPQDAALTFERFRGHVERYQFPQVGQITVSVGLSKLRSDDTPSSGFERADRAAYHAKQNGRNQVAHHAELVASGQLIEAVRDRSDAELF